MAIRSLPQIRAGQPRGRRPGTRVQANLWRCRESNPGPPSPRQGFSVRSPLCLYSALTGLANQPV